MFKHDSKNVEQFLNDMHGAEDMDEAAFQEAINHTVIAVEKDDMYNTKEKLKIYSTLTSLSNCDVDERVKWIKKAARTLK